LCHTASHHSTLRHTAILHASAWPNCMWSFCITLQQTAAHSNTLQHPAILLKSTQSRCVSSHCKSLQHTANRMHTLQHVAAHCNTVKPLQHTAIIAANSSTQRSYLHQLGPIAFEGRGNDAEKPYLYVIAVNFSVLQCVAGCAAEIMLRIQTCMLLQ